MLTRIVLVMVAVLVIGSIAACGRSDGDSDGLISTQSARNEVVDEQDAAAPEADMDADYAQSESGNAAQFASAGIDRRVIRSAELELYVSDVNASVRHARNLANDVGGYVDASTTRMMSEDDEIAQLTLEVPSSEFDDVLMALRDGPHVTRIEHESTDSRDVTEEYVDLQSRLGNLESTETRFLALLDEAARIDEILNVEREISRIRGEIEQVKGRINYLEQRTDYSRIHVAFYPEEETVTIAGQHFTPGESAREAWNASMLFIGAIGNAAITVGVFFWWAWPLVLGGVIWLVRYQRQRAASASTA
jgi:hypothetical protein